MSLRAVRRAALAIIGLGLFATAAALWLAGSVERQESREPLMRVAEVPDFALVNRDGRSIRRDDLLGRPWVADFIFTRCALSCPRMTSLMVRLGVDLPEMARVSFTVDPEHDTPEVLADYARSYSIGDPDWLFLTGGTEELETLTVEGFLLPVVRDPPEEAYRPDEPILHSDRFVLVDSRGVIRGYYQATLAEEYEKLLRDVARLEKEEGAGKAVGPTRDEPEPNRSLTAEACAREVEELHRFFEEWFVGTLPATDEAFARFAEALGSGFAIIGPGGDEFDRAAILEQVRGGHGSRSAGDFSIWIEDFRLRECVAPRCLATYEEWQRSGDEVRGRLSTVVFGAKTGAPGGLEWLHVHETWLPDGSEPSLAAPD